MSGVTRGEAIRRLDTKAAELKRDVMSYWEVAGMTEADRDRAIAGVADLFKSLEGATFRRVWRQMRNPQDGE